MINTTKSPNLYMNYHAESKNKNSWILNEKKKESGL